MESQKDDMNRQLMVDGNAVAGLLRQVFGREVTPAPTECGSCGKRSEIGGLLSFTHAPGIVLRCSACESVIMRISRTADAIYLDARGAVFLRLPA